MHVRRVYLQSTGTGIPIAKVIEQKIRAAAETGAAFVPLDELFKP